MTNAKDHCQQVIAHHSKSFALASRLLEPEVRDDAVVVYAWCRYCDDAVDLAESSEEQIDKLAQLENELNQVYSQTAPDDAVLAAFREVTERRGIPEHYPRELLAGMRMDIEQSIYDTTEELLLYCYRVAGVVGLMMAHVLGVDDPNEGETALRHATHLGMAMQLTNICRDVLEDWERGRLYLPLDLLGDAAATLRDALVDGKELPRGRAPAIGDAMQKLLVLADQYYDSGTAGLWHLSWRSALSIRTARRVYAEIGERVRAKGCDPWKGRAIVPNREKIRLAAGALVQSLWEMPRRWWRPVTLQIPRVKLRFPDAAVL